MGWVFFRAPDFHSAWTVLVGIASWAPGPLLLRFEVAKGLAIISLLVLLEAMSFRFDFRKIVCSSATARTLAFSGLLALIALAGTVGGDQFIYFQF